MPGGLEFLAGISSLVKVATTVYTRSCRAAGLGTKYPCHFTRSMYPSIQ